MKEIAILKVLYKSSEPIKQELLVKHGLTPVRIEDDENYRCDLPVIFMTQNQYDKLLEERGNNISTVYTENIDFYQVIFVDPKTGVVIKPNLE